MKTPIEKLKEMVEIQKQSANSDDYQLGLANGLILAQHTILDLPGLPPYIEPTKKQISESVHGRLEMMD